MGCLMSIVAPKARKHLSADALFGLVRNGFAHIPDARLSETDIALADALMAALSSFAMGSAFFACDSVDRDIASNKYS